MNMLKIMKLGEVNGLAYKDLILSINTNSSIGRVALGLAKNIKSAGFPEGNCKIAWDRLVSKYALHTASSLLKLESQSHNSKLESMEKDTDKWILNLEWLQICMNEFRQKVNITDEDFMIHVLKNLPGE